VSFVDLRLRDLEGARVADEPDVLVHCVERLRGAEEDRKCLLVDETVNLGVELVALSGVSLAQIAFEEPLEPVDGWSRSERPQ
jgi:hypothetical protein